MDGASAAYGLFGREDVVQVVNDLLDTGGSAVVVGEPGLGKSSLLKVANQLAQRRGRRVLSVAPTEFDRGLPFAGLAELVSQCPPGVEERLPEPQRRALAVALQRIESGEVDALAVPLAVRSLLIAVSESEPIMVIADDLQWLDRASAGSLAFAVRTVGNLQVLAATRPDPAANGDLVRSLPEPRREVVLGPLPDWAIGKLLRKHLGQRWTPPMSAGVARASAGNPFLALMIAQAMQSDLSKWRWGAQQGSDPIFPVPPSLVGLLSEKVSVLLTQESRDVLLLVAAAGRLTVPELQRIVEETRLRAALEDADDADVARIGAGSVVDFTHPLLASAIYDQATTAERRQAHRLLADKLEDPVERARHRSKSISAPDAAVAEELDRAADISRSRGALQLAGELLEGAALATPTDLDTTGSLLRWLRAVDTYVSAGDQLAARTALEKASALAAEAEQRAQILVRKAWLVDGIGASRAVTEQAFRLAPAGSEVRAEILQQLGEYHRMEGHGRLALRLDRFAIREAAAVGRPDVQLAALNQLQSVQRLYGLGDPRETLAEIDLLVDQTSGELSAAEWAWAHGFHAPWTDRAAERRVREGIARTVEAGRYGDLSSLYICLILTLIRRSKVQDAAAALDDADRIGAWGSGYGLQEGMARALVNAYSGELTKARDAATAMAARTRDGGLTYWLGGFLAQLGFVEVSARNWQAALEPLRELAVIVENTMMVDLEQLLWAVDYADAALQVGALDEVAVAVRLLRRQGAAGRAEASVAADRCDALLAAARGDVETALTSLRAVVDRAESECPFEAARSVLALGQVSRRAGYKGTANELLSAAASMFTKLGTPCWAERALDEAGRTGLHTSTGLTETERRVAELVASGASNQETAAQLFLSVKTVEANLTRVYRKLSLRTRTDLANHFSSSGPRESRPGS
ncbi:AAA family ATPase [Kribbella sp. NPDC059898]|uniref:AAA family ATPase n=1 Tax=Kribbella sp. NPDC059898 TaxID=3346995 RepID=UPI003649AE0E